MLSYCSVFVHSDAIPLYCVITRVDFKKCRGANTQHIRFAMAFSFNRKGAFDKNVYMKLINDYMTKYNAI